MMPQCDKCGLGMNPSDHYKGRDGYCQCPWEEVPLIKSDNMQTLYNALSRIAKLEAALRECADDLQGELEARYTGRDNYETEKRRFERDMQPVYTANELLAALTEEQGE